MQTTPPEAVGLSPERLARIDAAMQRHVDEGRVAGLAVAIARRGRLAYLRCFGLADREAARPIEPGTIYRIYSMSKPITVAGALILYEEGRFQLSDPVSDYIPCFKGLRVWVRDTPQGPEFAPAEPVTIWHLMTHTSGLVYANPEGSTVERMVWESDCEVEKAIPEETLAEWAPRQARLPLAFQPGSRWCYGLSHDLLGYLIECVAGTALDVFLRERIFAPLGMVDTGFWVRPEHLGRLAALYTYGPDGALERIDPPREGDFTGPCRFLSGGSGLVSTVGDYLRFAQMLLNRGELDGVRLLSRKTVELMTTDNLPPGVQMAFDGPVPGYSYGLGVGVRTGVAAARTLGSAGEFGWSGRAGTEFWVDPQEEMVGLIMPQLTPLVPASQFLADDFRVLAYQAIAD